MRILEMSCAPIGPFSKPILFQPQKPCTIICDENEAGKTTLVDIFVNLLFRKNSAQVRFQSKRYEGFQGFVKIMHKEQEVEFQGSADLDSFLGIPTEFSKLPIVRGSDLAFLWSGRRDKNAPLINACLRYFTASRERNLETVIKNLRSEAGLPPKTNSWSQAKLKELDAQLQLYRNKESYLTGLSQKEQLAKEMTERQEELAYLRKEIETCKEKLDLLAEEERAARSVYALGLFSGLEQLQKQFRESGLSSCGREDAGNWAKLEGERKTYDKRIRQLNLELIETERQLAAQRQQLADLELKLERLAVACHARQEELEKCQEDISHKKSVKVELTEELQGLVESLKATGAEKSQKLQRLFLASCGFAIFSFFFFLLGTYLGGFLFLALFFGSLIWRYLSGVNFRHTEQEILEKAKRIFRECELSIPDSIKELPLVFEGYWQKEEEKFEQLLEAKKQALLTEEQAYNELLAEKNVKEQQLVISEEGWQRANKELVALQKTFSEIEMSLENLRTKTSRPSLQVLEDSLAAKFALEKEISCAKAKLEFCLGPEREWLQRLAEARELLQKFPQARSLEAIAVLKEELTAKDSSLRLQETELLNRIDILKESRLEAVGRLQACGCENLSGLAWRLEDARKTLKENVRKALATIWVQQVLEKAKESLEDVLLEPLSRTAAFFKAITGCYTGVTYTKEEGDIIFRLCRDGKEYCEDILSDGTKAQFLFSLRLALLEKLFAEENFLILDDPLLTSSEKRKKQAIELLLSLAEKGWQIIYLTIDNVLAKIFQESGGELVSVCGVKDLLANEE